MKYIVMDLEWNGGYSRFTHGYFNEILEIGAVCLEESMTVCSEFQALVRPSLVEGLSRLVREMTGITREEAVKGIPFTEAMLRFQRWMGEEPAVILTWSQTDLHMLEENCRFFYGTERIPFLRQYADLQLYCQRKLGVSTAQQLGLEAAGRLLSLDEEGVDHHRALDDSRLTARILSRIYEAGDLLPYLQEADDEFYRRLNFKTRFLSDLEDPALDHDQLRFTCERCGRELIPEKEWRYRNRAFCSVLQCPSCGTRYEARVQFKEKYEGITVKRRLREKINEEEMQQKGEDNHGQVEIPGGV